MKENYQKAVFAAGCFWGVEEVFYNTPGVTETRVGYAGGKTLNPTYEEVLTHTTGHTESVEVTFDPKKISYEKLVEIFFNLHDPTTPDRQGPDIGNNYRSAIFYLNNNQKKVAKKFKDNLEKSKKFDSPIVTEISKLKKFYLAESYHQKYFLKHPNHNCPI